MFDLSQNAKGLIVEYFSHGSSPEIVYDDKGDIHPKAQAALDELVDAKLLMREPINGDRGFIFFGFAEVVQIGERLRAETDRESWPSCPAFINDEDIETDSAEPDPGYKDWPGAGEAA